MSAFFISGKGTLSLYARLRPSWGSPRGPTVDLKAPTGRKSLAMREGCRETLGNGKQGIWKMGTK